MQIVPEVETSQTSDCIVPDPNKVSSGNQSSNVTLIELSVPRLCLNPFTEQPCSDSSNTTLFFQSSSPRGIHSPSSPLSPQIVFFPDNSSASFISSFHSVNPFASSNSSILSQSLPVESSITPHSVGYESSQSLPIYLIPTDESNPSSPRYNLPPEHSLPTSSLQMHLHPQYTSSQHHRHSFSEGDSGSNPLLRTLLSPQSHNSHPHHGRRSLGSMLGTMRQQRRNSHHTPTGPYSEEPPRTRRRSHEPRDNQREILQGLQAAAVTTRISSTRPGSAGAY